MPQTAALWRPFSEHRLHTGGTCETPGAGDLDFVAMLRVLAVDDEPPALEELLYLLRADPRGGRLTRRSPCAVGVPFPVCSAVDERTNGRTDER